VTKRVGKSGGTPVNVAGRLGTVREAVPLGISPILRRFWRFAREMAKRFSKNLMKDREDEFLKTVRRDFDKWR